MAIAYNSASTGYSSEFFTYNGESLAQVVERSIADSVGLTDLLNRQRIIAKFLQDNVGITDDIEYLERAIDTIVSQMLEIREFKPMMLSVLQDKSQAKIVINQKPSYSSIENTVATFTSSSTLYNANITYNNSSQVYAGFDSKQSIGKTPSFIEDVKPEIISIG